MPICRTCGKEKKIHASGQCSHCYWIDYQIAVRERDKKRAGNKIWDKSISPRKMMHMRPEQIVANWKMILKGAGLWYG